MAERYVNIGSFGPFIYDDGTQPAAVETDGDIQANNLIAEGLSSEVRKVISNASKVLEEIDMGYMVVASIDNTNSPFTAGNEEVIIVDASGGDVTINLPDATTVGNYSLVIKRTDNSSNTVTVDGNSTQTIDGDETKELVQYDAMRIVSDGTEWWII